MKIEYSVMLNNNFDNSLFQSYLVRNLYLVVLSDINLRRGRCAEM